MTYVFFVYGLAFFFAGVAIMLYPKKGSAFGLARHLNFVAGFCVLHGINEWLDLFILIHAPGNNVLEALRVFTLPVSFLFLIQFGALTISIRGIGGQMMKAAVPLIFGLWLVVFLAGSRSLLMWDVWSRYLLCTPGALFTAWGLFLYVPELEKTKVASVVKYARLVALTFLLYALLAGLIVPRANFFPASVLNYDNFRLRLGFPVQILRSVCAVFIAYSIVRVLGIFRWESQENLRKSQLRYHSIADQAPIILFIADCEGIITFIEGKGLDLLNLKAPPSAGDNLCDVFGQDSAICRNSREALQGREFTSTDHIDSLIFQVYYNCLRDESDAVAGLVGVALDATAGLQAQAELEKFRNEVARTRQMALLGTLGRTMAEQLGEPLSVARPLIRKAIEDLSETAAASQTTKSLATALEKVSSAKGIIDSFCDKANIAAKPVAEPIDLRRMVRRIAAVFGEPANRVGLKLTTAGTDIVPGMFMSARQLEQIFFILIQNAIDAADPEKDNHLHISCRQDRRDLVLTFTDTCGGMTSEELTCVFEPFFVAQSSGRDLGMGLAIAKELITACKGAIVAESTPGKGTIFTVTLPIEQVY